MKKIFANILTVVLIAGAVQQSVAQNVQKQGANPVEKNARSGPKGVKEVGHKATVKATDAKAKPANKTVKQVHKETSTTQVSKAVVKEEPRTADTKRVNDKIREEEKRVAAAKQAHEQRVAKPEIKVVAAEPLLALVTEEEATAEKPEKKYDSTLCFPLKEDNIYSLYTFIIDLRDKRIISKYKPFFDRNNYEFTGYVWQGLLKQIINGADDNISHNVFIKAEDNLVCFTITRFDVKNDLPEYICPILSSPQLFASYVRKANREDINNY